VGEVGALTRDLIAALVLALPRGGGGPVVGDDVELAEGTGALREVLTGLPV